MNRQLVLTSVALSAVAALTGCGGTKKATTTGATATATKGRPTRAPSATVTARGTVRIGGFCTPSGAVGKTSDGAWARCQKRSGDSRARWYPERPAPGRTGVRAGQFCAKEGDKATSATGVKLVCRKKPGENRPRWRSK